MEKATTTKTRGDNRRLIVDHRAHCMPNEDANEKLHPSMEDKEPTLRRRKNRRERCSLDQRKEAIREA